MEEHIVRTHDLQIYSAESRHDDPKEIHKVLAARAAASGALRQGARVADFGCATGELLAQLTRQCPGAEFLGFDVLPKLIALARQKVPGVDFRVGSVLDSALLPPTSVDAAFLVGVHEIFDDPEPWLSNLIAWTRPGGRIFVFGMFNSFPIDVWIKYRLANDPDPNHREPGWNILSKATVSGILDRKLGPGRHEFTPFELPFDLNPRSEDPVRTWTILEAGGRRRLTNGLSLLCPLETLEIRLS